jgi:hypothetical protein
MERSFSEKMRLEEEDHAESGPEKLAMIEKMKASFYEDMQVRMETFFKREAPQS